MPRRRIVGVAFRIFAEQGYGSVSMRQLARDLGTSTGTLYHYFPSKHALFEALVTHRLAVDLVEATSSFQADTSPAEKQAALIAFISSHTSRLQDTLRITLDYARHDAPASFLPTLLDGYRRPLQDALGEEAGALGLSLLLGLLVQRMLGGQVTAEDHLQALARLSLVVAASETMPNPKAPQSTSNKRCRE